MEIPLHIIPVNSFFFFYKLSTFHNNFQPIDKAGQEKRATYAIAHLSPYYGIINVYDNNIIILAPGLPEVNWAPFHGAPLNPRV